MIRKNYFFYPYLLLILLFACQNKQEAETVEEEIAYLIDGISTEYEFPDLQLPELFYIDSLSIYDSLTQASYLARYLQCDRLEMESFNQASLLFVKEQISKEMTFVEADSHSDGSSSEFIFVMRAVEIYTNYQVYSISYIIDTYSEGGNHHNDTRATFNYNTFTNKIIEFDDVFQLNNKADSIAFILYAEQYSSACKDWGFAYGDLDFAFNENGIYIDPNSSWACAGTRSLIPSSAENKFVRKEWY